MDPATPLAVVTTATTAPRSIAAPGTKAYACRAHDSSLCDAAWNLTHDDTFSYGVDVTSLLISAVVIFLFGWIAQRVVRRMIKRTVSGLQGETVQRHFGSIRRRTPKALLATGQTTSLRRAQRAETIGALLRSASTVVIFVVACLMVLKLFALPVGSFVAGASVLTAVLAFGAQNIVRDFLAGFFLVVEDQYGVGDVIDVGEVAGMVESVSLRITRLRDENGTLWHIPNGEIERVGNKSQQWARAVIEFRIALDSDISKAVRLIKLEADKMWQDSAYTGIILEEPEVWGPEELGAKGILLKLAVKTKPLEQWQISRTLRSRVKRDLDQAGIRIATSTMPGTFGFADSGDD